MEAKAKLEKKLILGIDIGTTYVRMAYWNHIKNEVEIIPNAEGEKRTPAFVAF